MRAARLIALVLPLLAAPGCFVFDEIDAGMEVMESHTPKDKKKEAEKQAAGKAAEKPTYAKTTEAWWGKAKSLSAAPGDREGQDDPIVDCRRAGKGQFMKLSDCLARGGHPE